MVTFEDWRDTPAKIVARLYDSECARWYGSLGWDLRPSCELVEAARLTGRLRGFLARNSRSGIVGWTYFLLHQDTLQLGNLVAVDDAVVRGLLERVLGGADARRARRFSCFLFPGSDAIEPALAASGFSILRHAYLRRPLCDPSTALPGHLCAGGRDYRLGDWSAETVPALVSLLSSAYDGTREARCFAPDSQMEQWATYVHHLVHTRSCGRFERGLSATVQTRSGRVAGAILVTGLSDRTAHIAQMAIDPGHRCRGLGRWLVGAACQRAGAARYVEMTLLVAQSNDRARRVYDRLGFEPVTDFVFADRLAVPA